MKKRRFIALLLLVISVGCAHRGAFVSRYRSSVSGADALPGLVPNSPLSESPVERSRAPRTSQIRTYLIRRWRDLADVPELRAGFGGISFLVEAGFNDEDVWLILGPLLLIPEADVEATCLGALAVHGGARYMWGISDGSLRQTNEGILGFPWSNLMVQFWEGWRGLAIVYYHYDFLDEQGPECIPLEQKRDYGLGPVPLLVTYFVNYDPDYIGDRFGGPSLLPWYPPIRWADVRAGVTTLPVACSVGVSPGEFVDFLVGWFGLDPAGDDGRH